MKGNWLSILVLVITGSVLLGFASCGHSQQLVSIQVQPQTETFGDSNTPINFDAGLQVQLRALGTFIHPPVTKDITSQVTWTSNDVQMMTVSSSGLLTATGVTCGTSLVSATSTTNTSAGGLSSSGALVTGYMTGNVVCYTGSGGGSGNPAITLTFTGTGSGTVTSNPGGLSCASPAACVTQSFLSGTSITLMATPTGTSTFGGWGGGTCSGSATTCTFVVSGNTNISATFN